MHTFEWWTIPLVLEGVILIVAIIIAGMDRHVPGATLASVSWFIVASLVDAVLALSCWTFAG